MMELPRRCDTGEMELVRLASSERGMATSSMSSCWGSAIPPARDGAPVSGDAVEKGRR